MRTTEAEQPASRMERILLGRGLSGGRRALLAFVSVVAGTVIWSLSLGIVFRPGDGVRLGDGPPSPVARALAARHLQLWTDPASREAEIRKMRGSNPEWDFMARTFLSLSLAEMALREPAEKARCLEVIDRILAETLAIEREKGFLFFLMKYGRQGRFTRQPPRSLFVDGEIALVLAARRLVEEKAEYRPLLADRVKWCLEGMRAGPVLCAESYPDECWLFCNAAALAAVRLSDVLEGTDHSPFFREWVETARRRLVEPGTGLLVSSFSLDGRVQDGPEGSSIWMAAHCLSVVDPAFARDQYDRARRELGRGLLGFGYAREWPPSRPGPVDVDSGPIVPFLEASASSSGLALLGSASFGDVRFFRSLVASLDLAGFPVSSGGTLRYCASNAVGDAVMLYAMVQGPLWRIAREGRKP